MTNDELLKCELKRFGMKSNIDHNKDLLTKDEYRAVKEFCCNPDIVVRKADKSNRIVILDKTEYFDKLNAIVNDVRKFKILNKDPTEDLKRKLNQLLVAINLTTDDVKFSKLVGHYEPGYLYGNAKIHKNLNNPPLRPVISQIGVPTYEISKSLKEILDKYLPKTYSISSTNEFIDIVRGVSGSGLLASLDVESLFTNIPVLPTIEIVLNYAYNSPNLRPPPIQRYHMKELLVMCTTQVAFRHPDGSIFQQTDGVAMGSPLGPLLANFYMADLEQKVLDDLGEARKPIIYCRYIDDIFLLVQSADILYKLREDFEKNSVLKFCIEFERQRKINFLDVTVEKTD